MLTSLSHGLRRLTGDSKGATIVEFAMIAPTLVAILLFIFDTGLYFYAQAVLGGEVNAAARRSTLETATDTSRAETDALVEAQIQRLIPTADVTFSRTAYRSYGRAQAKAEDYKDLNNNGICDNNEAYDDANRNNVRDTDSGVSGGGAARDVVIYTATVTYERMFPVEAIFGWDQEASITSTALLRNQPFDKQPEPLIGTCV